MWVPPDFERLGCMLLPGRTAVKNTPCVTARWPGTGERPGTQSPARAGTGDSSGEEQAQSGIGKRISPLQDFLEGVSFLRSRARWIPGLSFALRESVW